jgi:hypothetical protein
MKKLKPIPTFKTEAQERKFLVTMTPLITLT